MPVRTIASDEIHFDDIPGPDEDAPVVVWGHGFLLSATFYAELIALLPEYRHVIPDLRGHGRSSAIETDGTLDKMATDIWDVVESLGITRFQYVGHSMGSAIGWRLAARHPEAVIAGVAIAGIPVTGKLPEAKQWVHSMIEMSGDTDALTAMISPLYKHLPGASESAKAAGLGGALVPRAIVTEIVTNQFHLDESAELLPALAQPWLFVASAEDESEPADHQVSQAALLPDSRTVVLEGEGHMAPQESPALVGPHIAAFLKEHAPV